MIQKKFEDIFAALLQGDSFEYLEDSFKGPTSKRLFLAILVLMSSRNDGHLSPAQFLLKHSDDEQLSPRPFREFASKYLLTQLRQELFNELYNLYRVSMAERKCIKVAVKFCR